MKADSEKQPNEADALFSALVWRLAVEARAFLGEQVHPEIEQLEPRLEYAAHSIDTIQMLKDRTEGRRSSAETEMLEGILGQLKLDYLKARRQQEDRPAGPGCAPPAGEAPPGPQEKPE
ncbi:MAG: DUF1844 domain-containing protein [bacterium]